MVRNQTNKSENGIYEFNTTNWIRTTDFNDATTNIKFGSFTFVENGDNYSSTGWVCISNSQDDLILETDDIELHNFWCWFYKCWWWFNCKWFRTNSFRYSSKC